jgi:hypothetical protein
VATPLHRSRGGQFVAHFAALPGNPYDGHMLATVTPAMETLIGNTINRILADAGYRGHNAPREYDFKVYTTRHQRRARRRRLYLSPFAQVAEAFVAQNPDFIRSDTSTQIRLKNGALHGRLVMAG